MRKSFRDAQQESIHIKYVLAEGEWVDSRPNSFMNVEMPRIS